MKKKNVIFATGIFFVLILAGIVVFSNFGKGYDAVKNFNGEIKFYKSGNCGCCEVYLNYFKTKGNSGLKVTEVQNNSKVMQDYKIPSFLESCHTMVVGNYFVEGHVPLEAIEKLLYEKPNILGIGMPGMPPSSPGMPGIKEGDFIIYGINNDGTSFEFMKI